MRCGNRGAGGDEAEEKNQSQIRRRRREGEARVEILTSVSCRVVQFNPSE